ncbi:MAG: 4a-hydroxytetrahydrobiopterin dehydratase [Paracoccaceae bacterium]|jgi:4a-hydroxytetrahydrobiopterin dehydratase
MSNQSFSQTICEACTIGAPAANQVELDRFLLRHSDWLLQKAADYRFVERQYKFKNYAQALEFTNQVSAMAETEAHHPEITLSYGKAKVQWWSHKIKDLHLSDLVFAARTDDIFEILVTKTC